ncbi:HD domain-containing phosphohydrolase [Chitinimonas sp.]|uniref:HD domain-containing phosphohydrolase n=1 Tax=Chitinimonas sp. TaxID=1934313 RepID=UPI002F93ED17
MPATTPPPSTATVPVYDAILALAFIGDLSMGRATDQSPRTGWLAAALARAAGGSAQDAMAAQLVSLLRWSGCTANAAGIGELLGDDVAAREQLMALTLPPLSEEVKAQMPEMAQIHCEVAGDIARMLALGSQVERSLRHVFEHYDGGGQPDHLRGEAVPDTVYVAALASDLEILSRAHGLERALQMIAGRAGRIYPQALADLATQHAADWLEQLRVLDAEGRLIEPDATLRGQEVALELIADVIDLKLPWMAGYSRQTASLAQALAARLGLDATKGQCIYRAGLIHGIGRAALPNALWNTAGPLASADWERVRLVPYWTRRAAQHTPSLTAEAELASYVYERLDGSGYFRSLDAAAIPTERRVLAVAAAWTALCARRPWREALSAETATELLQAEATKGRLDPVIVDALLVEIGGQPSRQAARAQSVLSDRETDVLRRISLGESNKEVARALAISPSTVRTHVESIFRKLECSTRAAATLKAFTLGVL